MSNNIPYTQPTVSMHLSSFAMPVDLQIIVTFITSQGPGDKTFVTRLQINRLSNTLKKFCGRHTDLVGLYKKNVCHMFADPIS